MYWSGDLAYKDADGFVYLAGRTADWMRVDGENLAAAPIERILQRLPAVNRVAVYAVPTSNVGDQVMAAIVLQDDATLVSGRARGVPRRAGRPVLQGLAALRPGRPRPARRPRPTRCSSGSSIAQGPTAGDGVLWVRESAGRRTPRVARAPMDACLI